jgi:hypothetical protein
MDARAIQNDRDRIGPTKKIRIGKRASSVEEDNQEVSLSSMSPQQRSVDEKTVEYLISAEKMCNLLRTRVLIQVIIFYLHKV